MTALNDLDRFHLVMDSIDRLPQTGDQGIYLKQQRKGKLGSAMAWASKKYRCDLDIKKMSSCALVQRARTDSGIGAGFDQITSWRFLAFANHRPQLWPQIPILFRFGLPNQGLVVVVQDAGIFVAHERGGLHSIAMERQVVRPERMSQPVWWPINDPGCCRW
jgi:hypothetical protein